VFRGTFRHNSKLNADDLSVPAASGTVTLEGIVSWWSEHAEAVAAAWAAPGVPKVDGRFLV
jgi:osmotically-inducible protein OsmY